MAQPGKGEDERAIMAIIERQFASLGWTAQHRADWASFAGDFLPHAVLYPAARPAQPQSVAAFVERMKGLAGTTLRTFRERALGAEIRVFGNVAIAMAACEIVENESQTSRCIEAMLLVRQDRAWKIAAQGWDMESAANPLPANLLGPRAT
jgi:ketosteroid isomerase-like protein